MRNRGFNQGYGRDFGQNFEGDWNSRRQNYGGMNYPGRGYRAFNRGGMGGYGPQGGYGSSYNRDYGRGYQATAGMSTGATSTAANG